MDLVIADPLVAAIFSALKAEKGSATDKAHALSRAALIANLYSEATVPASTFESLLTSGTVDPVPVER